MQSLYGISENATNQVNKYRIDQVCQLSAGFAVSQKFVAKHTHLKTVKVYFGNDYSGQASGKVILNIIDLETGKSIQRLTKNISDIVNNDYTEFKTDLQLTKRKSTAFSLQQVEQNPARNLLFSSGQQRKLVSVAS